MSNPQVNDQQRREPLRTFLTKAKYWQTLSSGSQERKNAVLEIATLSFCLASILDNALRKSFIERPTEFCKYCSLDNFLIRHSFSETSGDGSTSQWRHIKGVDMILPSVSLDVIEPASLNDGLRSDSDGGVEGKHLDVKFKALQEPINPIADNLSEEAKDNMFCHLVGVLMHEIISCERISYPNLSAKPSCVGNVEEPARKKSAIQQSYPETMDSLGEGMTQESFTRRFSYPNLSAKPSCVGNVEEPARKRSAIQQSYPETMDSLGEGMTQESLTRASSGTESSGSRPNFPTLRGVGLPSSIILLVESLLQCGQYDSLSEQPYCSLEAVCNDIRRAIIDPDTFLFPPQFCDISEAHENIWFRIREIRLYGREDYKSAIRDAFLRVASGFSEAFLIKGVSGVGKTKLAQSLLAQIRRVHGFVVMEKFDQMDDESPFSSVISAFNLLCVEIVKQSNEQTLQNIAYELRNEFHSDFSLLVKLLPFVVQICPQFNGTCTEVQTTARMSLHSISFILGRFMKVVSSKQHPVVLFLDDLQWADELSLGLIQSVLFDLERTSCFFFVGSYRSEEVTQEHAIFSMLRKLDTCGVQTTRIELDGLRKTDLNDMISDVLRVLPHICCFLTDSIFRVTDGNPFFSLMCLESLIERKSIIYSQIEQRWVWDVSGICWETFGLDIISLVSSKISGLYEETQSALKTMACFGIKILEHVAGSLSSTPQHSSLLVGLYDAVGDGLIERRDSNFRFIHDKFLEGCYMLIPREAREQYHFQLGVLLHSLFEGQGSDILLYLSADQFKKAPLLIQMKHAISIDIPDLFVKAGSLALKKSDFPRGLAYLSTAKSLLPYDHWSSRYELSRSMFLMIAKSSYACGNYDEASCALQQILSNCRCFEDKLDAYHLEAIMNCGGNIKDSAYKICCKVLSQLHQPVPDSLSPDEVANMVERTTSKIKSVANDDILKMNEASERTRVIFKFYVVLVTVAFIAKPTLTPYCVCTMIHLSLTQGVSEYSSIAFACYASMLCSHARFRDIPLACRIGKLAMSFQKDFDMTEQMANLIAVYYGFAASFAEPFQTIADMHRRGFEIGLSTGDIGAGFINPMFGIRAAFHSGANLHTLLKETKDYIKRAKIFGQAHSKYHLELYRDTISTLIGKKKPTSSSFETGSAPVIDESHFNFHLAIRSLWLGHYDRCEHTSRKIVDMTSDVVSPVNKSLLLFVQGLNVFLMKKGMQRKLKKERGESFIEEMKTLARLCPHNFDNKLRMIEAEFHSLNKKNDDAAASYAAAIESSKKSQFVHEEGLANELAGAHYMNIGEMEQALSHFHQSKLCYEKWGSDLKVAQISGKIEALTKQQVRKSEK